VIEIVTAMATAHPEMSLKLFLQAAQVRDMRRQHTLSSWMNGCV
jgi:hypothetical protein